MHLKTLVHKDAYNLDHQFLGKKVIYFEDKEKFENKKCKFDFSLFGKFRHTKEQKWKDKTMN